MRQHRRNTGETVTRWGNRLETEILMSENGTPVLFFVPCSTLLFHRNCRNVAKRLNSNEIELLEHT